MFGNVIKDLTQAVESVPCIAFGGHDFNHQGYCEKCGKRIDQ